MYIPLGSFTASLLYIQHVELTQVPSCLTVMQKTWASHWVLSLLNFFTENMWVQLSSLIAPLYSKNIWIPLGFLTASLFHREHVDCLKFLATVQNTNGSQWVP